MQLTNMKRQPVSKCQNPGTFFLKHALPVSFQLFTEYLQKVVLWVAVVIRKTGSEN